MTGATSKAKQHVRGMKISDTGLGALESTEENHRFSRLVVDVDDDKDEVGNTV